MGEDMPLTDKMQIIDQLYTKYYRELLHCSFSLFDCKGQFLQEAEDCVQDTFEKAMGMAEKLAEMEEPLKYLLVMCRNITRSRRRNIRLHRKILGYPKVQQEQQDVADPKDIVTDWLIRQEHKALKEELLQRLSEREREIFDLYFVRDLSMEETARAANVTHGSVRGCVQRIRAKAVALAADKFFLIITCILAFLCT